MPFILDLVLRSGSETKIGYRAIGERIRMGMRTLSAREVTNGFEDLCSARFCKMIAVARLPISVTRRVFVFFVAAHDRFHLVF